MKRVTKIIAILLLAILPSCYTEVPDTYKITYTVTGSSFDVIYRNSGGTYEYVYEWEGVFKAYVNAPIDQPVYLLAKGSDDIVIHIRIKDVLDTVRKAKTIDSELVFIEWDPVLNY